MFAVHIYVGLKVHGITEHKAGRADASKKCAYMYYGAWCQTLMMCQ